MCTVTFIPNEDKIFLTANRDEKRFRSPAEPPAIFQMSTGNILFPKDKDGGGTWISLHENGNAVVFLNGGFVRHIPKPPYRKSRGLILLSLADTDSPLKTFLDSDLYNIEPFTAVILENEKLFECRWDGNRVYSKELDIKKPHIWSSVTLYDDNVIAKREMWFKHWLEQHRDPGLDDILDFHQFTGDGDLHNDLMMNRDGLVFTVSVTGMQLNGHYGQMKYIDLRKQHNFFQQIDLCKAIPIRR